ncbi:MAG TPA: hypothetical protein VFB63_02640 [Bryobacteraceae bacterium]|nr:hypothetical protein [Bryobacteraceae bacterium]
MSQINFILADILDSISGDNRATITGKLGSWMMNVGRRVSGVTAVEITWCTGSGRPGPSSTDILVYVTTDVDRSVIEATGGNISEARSNPKIMGLTQVGGQPAAALSEVYWGRAMSAIELAGGAFHEAAHNKSQQDNEMHKGKDGLLVSGPFYGSPPTEANLQFMASHVMAQVQQTIVPHGRLTKAWYT